MCSLLEDAVHMQACNDSFESHHTVVTVAGDRKLPAV
jgi:hypothetical protein